MLPAVFSPLLIFMCPSSDICLFSCPSLGFLFPSLPHPQLPYPLPSSVCEVHTQVLLDPFLIRSSGISQPSWIVWILSLFDQNPVRYLPNISRIEWIALKNSQMKMMIVTVKHQHVLQTGIKSLCEYMKAMLLEAHEGAHPRHQSGVSGGSHGSCGFRGSVRPPGSGGPTSLDVVTPFV